MNESIMTIAIFLFRPLSLSDPCLVKVDNDYLFPLIIKQLQSFRYCSKSIISIPDNTPLAIKTILSEWGVKIDESNLSSPQQRVGAVMQKQSGQAAFCFSAYNCLLDGISLQKAGAVLKSGEADFVYTHDVITAKHFCALNLKAVNFLCSTTDTPIAPNRFHEYIPEDVNHIKQQSLSGLETPGERFLWDLHYAGRRQQIPQPLLQSFFSRVNKNEWFDAGNFRKLLASYLNIADWQWLDNHFSDNPYLAKEAFLFATQLAWFRRLKEHLPEGKNNKFLEIGFGYFPVTAYLLLSIFKYGIAIEPSGCNNKSISDAVELCQLLIKHLPEELTGALEEKFDSQLSILNHRLQVTNTVLEKLELPSESIDFCFSKTVLEHVRDMKTLSTEFFRVMKPGGVMLHEIDFSDHRQTGSIGFNFLEYSKEEWEARNEETNLWRINDFSLLWEQLGFDTEIIYRENSSERPNKIHLSWVDYPEEDLFCHTAIIKVTKKI
jgi:SAM-dependent methyltransferase